MTKRGRKHGTDGQKVKSRKNEFLVMISYGYSLKTATRVALGNLCRPDNIVGVWERDPQFKANYLSARIYCFRYEQGCNAACLSATLQMLEEAMRDKSNPLDKVETIGRSFGFGSGWKNELERNEEEFNKERTKAFRRADDLCKRPKFLASLTSRQMSHNEFNEYFCLRMPPSDEPCQNPQ